MERCGLVVERWTHDPKVVGSIPAITICVVSLSKTLYLHLLSTGSTQEDIESD